MRDSRNGITLSELVDATYADDPEGGPLYANIVVQQIIRRINQRIVVAGLAIRATKLGRGAKYKLVRADCVPKKISRPFAERAIA